MSDLRIVAIHPLFLVRWLPLEWFSSIISSAAEHPASTTSHSDFLTFVRCLEQFLQPCDRLPVEQ